MSAKLVLREVTNILGAYLYDHNPKSSVQVRPNIKRPLDQFMRSYFNTHKYLGSSERSSISERVYNLVRYQYLLSHLIRSRPYDQDNPQPLNAERQRQIQYKNDLLFSSDFYNAMDNPSLPKHIRTAQNKELFRALSLSLAKPDTLLEIVPTGKKHRVLGDEEAAFQVSSVMNTKAPLTLRFNPLKAPSHQIVESLEKKLKLRLMKCEWAPFGFKIVAPKNINLLQTEQFEKGFFQIQDQGSQITALRAEIRPGQLVLDYCGGSGGKSLAIAHLMQGKGQIYIHEPREVALGKAKKRFARAGVENVQFHSDQSSLSKMMGKIHWVIVDAPCTGTGTLRRNPDMKLKYTEDWLKRSVLLQQQIIRQAMRYMRDDGRMLYITCSLLRQENEDQVQEMCKVYGLQLQKGEVMKILPQKDGSDGYFAAVLKRRKQ